jgi:hypothetical protein
MKFKRLKKRREPNIKRGIILVILLMIVIYLWMNAEGIIRNIFG